MFYFYWPFVVKIKHLLIYEVIKDHIRLTLDSRVQFSRDVDRGYALRSMGTPNLLTSHSRTNLFKFSFMNRIVGEWNRLPVDIREASFVADFKVPLTPNFFLSRHKSPFLADHIGEKIIVIRFFLDFL